jgi:hypothetical protein
MKQKKLTFRKIKIQRLTVPQDREQQKEIKGGSPVQAIIASVPIFCLPITPGNG